MDSVRNYIILRVKGFNSQWKDVSYEDRKYITDKRLYDIEPFTQPFETEEYYYSTDYPKAMLPIPVASITYKRKILEIDISENVNLESINGAEELLVIDENAIYYQCKIAEEPVYELQNDTHLYRVIITLRVLIEYQNASTNKLQILNEDLVNDFCTSTYLATKYDVRDFLGIQIMNT